MSSDESVIFSFLKFIIKIIYINEIEKHVVGGVRGYL